MQVSRLVQSSPRNPPPSDIRSDLYIGVLVVNSVDYGGIRRLPGLRLLITGVKYYQGRVIVMEQHQHQQKCEFHISKGLNPRNK